MPHSSQSTPLADGRTGRQRRRQRLDARGNSDGFNVRRKRHRLLSLVKDAPSKSHNNCMERRTTHGPELASVRAPFSRIAVLQLWSCPSWRPSRHCTASKGSDGFVRSNFLCGQQRCRHSHRCKHCGDHSACSPPIMKAFIDRPAGSRGNSSQSSPRKLQLEC